MTIRSSHHPVLLAAAAALLVGGAAGWWLATRSMSRDYASSRTAAGEATMEGMEPSGLGAGAMGAMEAMQPSDAGTREPGPRGDAPVVQVDPVRLQRIGVRYAAVKLEPLGRTIRAEAAVTWNEERKTEVTTRVAGWVERLHVDRPGQPVRRGQPLLEIYSPELVSTQRELVLALEHADRAGVEDGAPPSGRHAHDAAGAALSPNALVEAARRRLALWDIPPGEIEQLERTREVRRTLTLAAPATGVVVEKHVLKGARVEPGEPLYVLAEIGSVWVEARVFEKDLADIATGSPATVEVEAYPGEAFAARVSFVYPYLDPATRTVAVRLEVPNPDGRLKPGMFATVAFDLTASGPEIVVPASAVVETGERSFVLLKRGEGTFEPREVVVRERTSERVALAGGLAPGDTVVTSANFLIDSEANLMAFMGGMLGMGMPAEQMRMQGPGEEGMDGMEGMEPPSPATSPGRGRGGREGAEERER